LLSLIVLAVSFTASSQVYVTVRPPIPHYVRPVAPSPSHIWIDEEWEERGGQYAFVGGHWALPPHPGWFWAPGHWRHTPRGEQWFRGHWRRR
jgi:hypothetical protein